MTKPKTPTKYDPCPQSPSGAHWYVIEPYRDGNNGIVGGACRECGAEKQFNGVPPVNAWELKVVR